MRIERVRLFFVRLPLVHRFETSSHSKDGIEHVLVELTDRDGTVGWGEIASPSDPYFCSETVDTSWNMSVRHLVHRVLAHEWEHPADLETSWVKVRGHEFAKAGFAGAAWDLFSRTQGTSLASALGGTRSEVHSGVSLGIEPSIDALLAQVQRQLEAGYGRVKLKIAPGWDLEPVRATRAAFPKVDLHVDANAAYLRGEESTALFRSLDPFDLTMIEQPFGARDFIAHAELQKHLQTSICLDESIVSIEDLETMLRMRAGRILNIKVSRMGGLTQAKRAHDLAEQSGVPVWCGGMHEFGIGRATNVALSSLPNFSLPSDVSGSDKYYARDIIDPPVHAIDGVVAVSTSPGLGYRVDVEWIEREALQTFDSTLADQAGAATRVLATAGGVA